MNWKLCVIFLFILSVIGVTSAIPPLPYEFYGNVSINGTPAESGILIIAKIGEIEIGNITTEQEGAYGGSGTFDKRLVVNGEENQIGEYITFWAKGMQSEQKVKLYAGESQRLDLTFVPGKEGSVDASVVPSNQNAVSDVPTSEPQPSPTKSPLIVIPIAAGLALLLVHRRS